MKQFYILILLISSGFLNAQVTDVVTGLNTPVGLVLNGNDLYIAEIGGNRILKIDITANTLTATEVVTGLNGPIGLELNGNDLYIAEAGGKISKMDITATTPTATDVLKGLNRPAGLQLNGNDLYIAEANGNKISKFNLPSLSVEDYHLRHRVYLYPNPAISFIQVSGLTKIEEFKIYNLLGEEVLKGKILNNKNINIQALSNGIYILKIDNGSMQKFIKN